jgi:hypothetical protein
MKRITRLTESDLTRIVRRVIKEEQTGTVVDCIKELEASGFRNVPPICMGADVKPEICAMAIAKQNMNAAKQFGKCIGGDVMSAISRTGMDIATEIKDIFSNGNSRCYPEINKETNTVTFPGGCIPPINRN